MQYWDIEEIENAIQALNKARIYIQKAHNEAELRHDTYGDNYMNINDYEIMEETDHLLKLIDELLDNN